MPLRERAEEEDRGISSTWRRRWTTRGCPRPPAISSFVDVYHELSHPVRVLDHIRRALRPGARWCSWSFAPRTARCPSLRHKMSKAQVLREMAAGGFELARETDDLPWQHVMSFRVAAPDPGASPA